MYSRKWQEVVCTAENGRKWHVYQVVVCTAGSGVYSRKWCIQQDVMCTAGSGVYSRKWCVQQEVVCTAGSGAYRRKWCAQQEVACITGSGVYSKSEWCSWHELRMLTLKNGTYNGIHWDYTIPVAGVVGVIPYHESAARNEKQTHFIHTQTSLQREHPTCTDVPPHTCACTSMVHMASLSVQGSQCVCVCVCVCVC